MARTSTERRHEPRVPVALDCTLRRRVGSPISCRTVDVGVGGMSVASGRPLAPDELVVFELGGGGGPLSGRAIVLREQAHKVYALRFEHLPDGARSALADLIRT